MHKTVATNKSKAPEGFDPKRSKISDDKLQNWRAHTITGDLQEVPGIGPAAEKKLRYDAVEPITNTYQLFGKYLSLKGPDTDDNKVSIEDHNEKFWYYLKDKGISSYRSGIVQCIAEKAATFFPGIYDKTLYQDEVNENDEENNNNDDYDDEDDTKK